MKLSVVLVTRNEAELLDGCLGRLGFEDELVILDMHSTDDTVAIAERHGARVVTIDPDPFVVRVRNIGLDEAKGDWILYLDPDEYVPPGFGDQLRAGLEHTDAAAFFLPFRAMGFGRTLYHGDIQEALPKRRWFRRQDLEADVRWPKKLCLFKAGAARWPDDPENNHVEPVVDGPVRVWEGDPIDHLLFRSVEQQIEKHIRYIVHAAPGSYARYPLTPTAPLRSLYDHMIVQEWWRDGTAGLAEALMFTMRDWIGMLHEWERVGFPEIRVRPAARASLATLDALHRVGAAPRKAAGRAKRLAGRTVR